LRQTVQADKGGKLRNPCRRGNRSIPLRASPLKEYLAGHKLYGDDFSLTEIERWYEDERESYAKLGNEDRASYRYKYHSLNRLHGFRFIRGRRFRSALGLGSAYGDEFLPIASQIDHITVVEPSNAFRVADVRGVPCDYVKPAVDGSMPFADETFDLALCLGVLHHIPNVTTVVKELYRCLSKGGYLLLREPIDSRGDWSKPRRHATKRERGIPLQILSQIVGDAGFRVVSKRLCVVPPIARVWWWLGMSAYNSDVASRIDAALGRLFRHRVRYHGTRLSHKIRPMSVYFVLTK
jgi:SAM-dependent methyltransferase